MILWSCSRPGWDTTQVSGCPFMLRLGTRWNSDVTAAERECLKERLEVVPLTSVSQVTLGAGLPSAVQEAARVSPWPSSSAGPGFSDGRGGTADGGGGHSLHNLGQEATPQASPGPAPPQARLAHVQVSGPFFFCYFTKKDSRRVVEFNLTLYLCPLFEFFTMSMGQF